MRKLLTLVLALVVVCLPLRSMAEDSYEINVILPQTGGGAFLGNAEIETLKVLEKLVNSTGGIRGRPIKFAYLDDQSIPQVAVQLTNQVIAKKVPIVIGSTLVALCSAMAPILKNGPVMYCLSPGIYPDPGSYAFAGSTAIKELLTATARYYRLKGYKKLAVITSTDATGQDGEKNVDIAFSGPEGQGIQIVDREHFNLTDISVAAQMSHIKASGAEAVVAWMTGAAFSTILRGAQDAGLTIPITTSTGNLAYKQLDGYKGLIGNNIYFPGSPGVAVDALPRGRARSAVETYLRAMKEAGIRPDQASTLAWDPTLILIEALRKFGTDATPAQIREYVAGLKNWTGIYGPYDFEKYPQRGIGGGATVMVRWDTAKDTWVSVSSMGGTPLK
jgi:branched-chain amino acid transport system substrate-binding protein